MNFLIELDFEAMARQMKYLKVGDKGSGPRARSMLPLNESVKTVLKALCGKEFCREMGALLVPVDQWTVTIVWLDTTNAIWDGATRNS